MHSSALISVAAFLAGVKAHGVILNAQGDAGSPASVGFQVDLSLPRNCTTISPCQQDTTLIRDAEIDANIVNQCGRTELTGNIDVGENTENALAADAVTSVSAGSQLTVTIHQVNADGAGPYTCDLDETSNSGVISHNLTVTNNVPGTNGLSQAKEQDFNITVTMPSTLNCTGASTGNVCTVRCRNNAVAGPFGGCFAVQQSDTTAKVNTAENIETAVSLASVEAQVIQNKADLAVALQANANAGTDEALANEAKMAELLGITVTTKASAVETPAAALGDAETAPAEATSTTTNKKKASSTAGTTTSSAATATSTSTSTSTTKKGKGNKSNKYKRSVLANSMRWAKRALLEENDS